MYHFSRAIYRELEDEILEDHPLQGGADQPRARAQGVRVHRLPAGDRHALLRQADEDAVQRHPDLLPDVVPAARLLRRRPLPHASAASTCWPAAGQRLRHRGQPARVPRDHAPRAPPASACRCRTTATARPTSTWRRPRRSRSPRSRHTTACGIIALTSTPPVRWSRYSSTVRSPASSPQSLGEVAAERLRAAALELAQRPPPGLHGLLAVELLQPLRGSGAAPGPSAGCRRAPSRGSCTRSKNTW